MPPRRCYTNNPGTSEHDSPTSNSDISESKFSAAIRIKNCLQTGSAPESEKSTTGSPSTAVTTNLNDLKLKGPIPRVDFGTLNTSKLGPERGSGSGLDNQISLSSHVSDAVAISMVGKAGLEIPETPQHRACLEDVTSIATSPLSTKSTSSRMTSPPPLARAGQPPLRQATPNPLTWQDAEITGYDINGPDDDGEGINGIGFRPTPAMAYARSQQRRRQVREWRAREAREAREKRIERRRNWDTGAHESNNRTSQRDKRAKSVRFAEATQGCTPKVQLLADAPGAT